MVFPDEMAALQRVVDRSSRQWLILVIVAVLLAVFPILLYVVTGKGHLDHIAGRSEPVTAQVDSVRIDGSCRGGVDKYVADLSWTVDGVPGHRTYNYCRDPELGDTVQVWVGPNGYAEIDSPTEFRLGLGLIGLGSSVFIGGGLAAATVVNQRQRRRLLAVADGTFSSERPIEVVRVNRRFRPARMHITETVPGSVVDRMPAKAVLYTHGDDAPKTLAPRQVVGTWWMHLGPPTDTKRRAGLLVRGRERCWIELPAEYASASRRGKAL